MVVWQLFDVTGTPLDNLGDVKSKKNGPSTAPRRHGKQKQLPIR
jgi:hypothetical protein